VYVLGLAFDDHKDDRPDEDHYVAHWSVEEITPHMSGGYEVVNHTYIGTHKGAKDYLPSPRRALARIPIELR